MAYDGPMVNLVLLLFCLVIGFLLRVSKRLPENAASTLSALILHVPLPAMIILSIPRLEWSFALISLCLVAWIIFAASFLFFRWLGPKLGWDQKVIGCLILTGGLGNTAFVGFPIIETFFGKESLKHAILLDQAGSFLIASSLGIWVATFYAHGKMPAKELFKRVISFPPFVAFSFSLLLSAFTWQASGDVEILLEKLSSLLAPIALITVGLQLKFEGMKEDAKYLLAGLGFKLFFAPLLIFGLYHLGGVPEKFFRVAVMEAAMAPMTVAYILASTHGLHPRLAGKMLGLGVPISFLTLTLWYYVL